MEDEKKGYEHLTCRPDVFKEFRKLRNLRQDTRTDSSFIKLLLDIYKKQQVN